MASNFFLTLLELTGDKLAVIDIYDKLLGYRLTNMSTPTIEMIRAYLSYVKAERAMYHMTRMIKTLGFWNGVETDIKGNLRQRVAHIMDPQALSLIEAFDDISKVIPSWLSDVSGNPRYRPLISRLIRTSMGKDPKFPQEFLSVIEGRTLQNLTFHDTVDRPLIADLVSLLLEKNPRYPDVSHLLFLAPYLGKVEKVIAKIVPIYGEALRYASPALRDNKDVVLAAVSESGYALKYASERLKDDPTIVSTAMNQTEALQYASDRLRSDRNFMLSVLRRRLDFRYMNTSLFDDKEIVAFIVSKDGSALKYASGRLKDDLKIVNLAVSNHGSALKYASERLKDDGKVVDLAVSNYGIALEYASERLRDDEFTVLHAVDINPNAIKYVSKRLQLQLRRERATTEDTSSRKRRKHRK